MYYFSRICEFVKIYPIKTGLFEISLSRGGGLYGRSAAFDLIYFTISSKNIFSIIYRFSQAVNYSQLSQGASNFNGFSNHFIAGSGWFTTGHGQKGTCPNAYIDCRIYIGIILQTAIQTSEQTLAWSFRVL